MLKMVKYYIEQSWLLVVAAFAFGLLLAVTNAVWSERIETNKTGKLNALMANLIAEAKFELAAADVPIDAGKGKIVKSNLYKAIGTDGQCKGFCFNASGPGFADKIEIVIAVGPAFEKIAGFSVLASNETPGFGDRISHDFYLSQFIGAPVGKLAISKTGDDKIIDDEIIAISGATVSSDAVINIFNNFLEQIKDNALAEGVLTAGN